MGSTETNIKNKNIKDLLTLVESNKKHEKVMFSVAVFMIIMRRILYKTLKRTLRKHAHVIYSNF